MIRLHQLSLPLDHTPAALRAAVLERLSLDASDLQDFSVFKRSADARSRRGVQLIYSLDIDTPREAELLERFAEDPHVQPTPNMEYQAVAHADAPLRPRPVIIGMGPCGLFAGLILAEMGLEPLILERGKKVRERTVDTFGFWRKNVLDPESNVQFGEGGAGTFSDGKLYSQVRDPRHLGRKVLTEFVEAGAPEEILWQAKPHIGTFKLVKMVEHLRAKIEGLGGEIRFQARVESFHIEQTPDGQRHVRGVILADGEHIRCDHLVLAAGHSARDTFQHLYAEGVQIDPKPFSVGFRVEHPQALIDRRRYGKAAGHPLLGAADYKLVHHCKGERVKGRSVYSFCMCPGGTVVAAASELGRVVTNGMSQYDRSERNANAGIVVGLQPEDTAVEIEVPEADLLPGLRPGEPLAGITFQRHWEAKAFVAGGSTYEAPGQKIGDFLAGRASKKFGDVLPSYKPGVQLGDLSECLPSWAIDAIREAIPAFDRKLKGFAMPDALFTGVETRTSSPIRIPRGEDMQSVNTRGLYPAGEGAGYAGGILSAGIDGIRVAEAVGVEMVG